MEEPKQKTRAITKEEKKKIFEAMDGMIAELLNFLDKYVPHSPEKKLGWKKIQAASRMIRRSGHRDWAALVEEPKEGVTSGEDKL